MTTNVQQQPSPPPVEKKRWDIWRWINSPWIFAAIPLIAGAVWLVQNLWVITTNLDKPFMMLIVPVAAATGLAAWLVFKFFTAIAAWAQALWTAILTARRADPIAWFFWLTIYILLGVSVIGSGAFFEEKFPHPIPGIGYGIAFTFDLVTVNAMRARLEAKRMRETSIAWLYLLAIVMCSSATIFGNVYVALDYAHNLPAWMLTVSPWLAFIFPTMIIIMSILADFLLEKTSTRLDVATYRAKEEDRLKLLVARREIREKMAIEEAKIAAIDAKEKGQEFILKAWLFTQRRIDKVVEILALKCSEIVVAEMGKIKQEFAPNNELVQQQKTLQNTIEFQQKQLAESAQIIAELRAEIIEFRSSFGPKIREEIATFSEEFQGSIERQMGDEISQLETRLKESQNAYRIAKNNERGPLNFEGKQDALNASVLGLTFDEKKMVLAVYPGVEKWLNKMPIGVSKDEILKVTGVRQLLLDRAIEKGTLIRPAKGPGNRYQTETIIRWLLREIKRTNQPKKEPITGELEAVKTPSNEQPKSNGNAHHPETLNDYRELTV